MLCTSCYYHLDHCPQFTLLQFFFITIFLLFFIINNFDCLIFYLIICLFGLPEPLPLLLALFILFELFQVYYYFYIFITILYTFVFLHIFKHMLPMSSIIFRVSGNLSSLFVYQICHLSFENSLVLNIFFLLNGS